MKNAKKVLAVVALIAITAVASVAGTLAYLTDRDSEVNVFTVGDVSIDLNETFDKDNAQLLPGMDIEKKPVIKNTGKNDAWVWAVIAIPSTLDNSDASKNVVHFNYSKESVAEGLWRWQDSDGEWLVKENVKINNVEYNFYTVLYDTILEPGAETEEPVMVKVYMDTHVDITPEGDWYWVEKGEVTDLGWNTEKDGNPVIYVSAYAIQAEGFEDVNVAYAAYQEQWGENGAEYLVPTSAIADAEDLAEALKVDGNIIVEEDLAVDGIEISAARTISLDLDDKKVISEAGLVNNGVAEIDGGELEVTASGLYGTRTTVGGDTTYNGMNLVTSGGGVNVWGTAVWNDGDITTNSLSTSARHMFYVAGGEEGDGHLTINGGEFTFNPTNLTRKGSYLCAHGEGAVIIVNGGTFHKPSTRTAPIQELDGGSVTIYGGTFAFDPSAFVAEGYEAVKGTDGYWTVNEK